jgi:hypothetical protein
MGIALAIAVTLAVVVIALIAMVNKLIWVSTPNEALIFSGAQRKLPTLAYRCVAMLASQARIERVDVMDQHVPVVVVQQRY